MNKDFLLIYNNLIKITRNKNLYLKLVNKDTFSDRLIFLLFHFGFFLNRYNSELSKEKSQDLFDFVIKQIELSIREIGYGDVSVNKKMKEFVNLFYAILEKIETWNISNQHSKMNLIRNYINSDKNLAYYVDYFDKYRNYLIKNSLNKFTKDIINFKF